VTVRHLDDDSRETLTVGNSPGTTDTLALTSSWTKIPVQYAVYSFGEVNRLTKLFRVLKITRSQDLRRRITAIEYVPEIYDDYAVISEVENPSDLTFRDLKAVETWGIGTDGTAQSIFHLSWRGTNIGGWEHLLQAVGGHMAERGMDGNTVFHLYGLARGTDLYHRVSATSPETDLTVHGPSAREIRCTFRRGGLPGNTNGDKAFPFPGRYPGRRFYGDMKSGVGGTSWANATNIIDGVQGKTRQPGNRRFREPMPSGSRPLTSRDSIPRTHPRQPHRIQH
jgi:hypothetical protein